MLGMQVKSVVALLKRYEGLFQLPSRIRQSTEKGEFDQVTPPPPPPPSPRGPCCNAMLPFHGSASGSISLHALQSSVPKIESMSSYHQYP